MYFQAEADKEKIGKGNSTSFLKNILDGAVFWLSLPGTGAISFPAAFLQDELGTS